MADEKPTAYVEPTIPSYLTALPSRDLLVASHQQITETGWRGAPDRLDRYVSQTVLDEATQGDASAVQDRLASLRGLTVLSFRQDVQSLAAEYIHVLELPPKAINDAVHLAYAVAR